MKRAISQILKVVTRDGKLVNISIAQKQSEMGLVYNKRLFLLVENQYFGYLSSYKETDDPNSIDLTKCKVVVPIKNVLRDVQRNKNVVSISFYLFQNKKKVNKKWVIRFNTENLAMLWERLFGVEIEKATRMKSPSKNKIDETSSPMRNQAISSNNQLKPFNQNRGSSNSKESGKLRDEIKREFSLEKKIFQPIQEQKVYKNELYESDRNKSREDNILNSSLLKNQKKSSAAEQQELLAQKLQHEQMAKKQMQKINRQKEELQRKARELQQKERRIREEQIRLQQSIKIAQLKEQQERERERLRERQRQRQRQRERQLQKQRQKQRQKPTLSKNHLQPSSPQGSKPSSPKNPNLKKYNELISSVIYGSPSSPKNSSPHKDLQMQHEMLLEEEKKKFNNFSPYEKPIPKIVTPKDVSYELGWVFKQMLFENSQFQFDVIKQFEEHCATILKQLTQQLHLPQRKRKYLPKYKSQDHLCYSLRDIHVTLPLIGLKEAKAHGQGGDQLCDQGALKRVLGVLRGWQYIRHILQRQKSSRVKLPLLCLVEWQGFVGLFRAAPRTAGAGGQGGRELLAGLGGNWLARKDNALIMKLDKQFYTQLAKQIGCSGNFDGYILQQIKQILPLDLLFQKQDQYSSRKGSKDNVFYLRPELIGKYKESGEIIHDNIVSSLRGDKSKISIGQGESTQRLEMEKLSQNILIPLSALISSLDFLEFYFIHPRELSSKMHEMGVNIRYLGSIYENCTLSFTRGCIISEIAARTCKALFRKTIQDLTLEQQQQIVNIPKNQTLLFKIIDFFNCILGNSLQTKAIWQLLSAHSKDYFNIQLNLQQIQKGYFLSSVIYHCGLEVDWKKLNPYNVFQVSEFFNEDNFYNIKTRNKSFEPFLTEEQQRLFDQIERQDPNAFKVLQQDFKLKTNGLPQVFHHEKYIDSIRMYVSNFVAPDIATQRGYKQLDLYTYRGLPTKNQFALKFMQLKWYLKKQKRQKYIATFSQINEQITQTFGDFHPLLSQLYDSMSMYHLSNGQFEDAITFCKSSVINMIKISGTNHQRVGQSYYQLAVCCIKAGKKDEAITSLQKSKQIFQANNKQQDIAYSHVCLKLGLLFLNEGKSKQTENIVKFALASFNKYLYEHLGQEEFPYEEERVECYEILARCYELADDREGQRNLSVECQKEMRYINIPSNLQKILKVIFSPILGSLSVDNAEILLNIIDSLPIEMNVNSYLKAYERIHQRIEEGTLVENVMNYLENIQAVEKFIVQNNSIGLWKGLEEVYERETVNDFLSLCEELVYFLGEGFVTGTIRDNL